MSGLQNSDIHSGDRDIRFDKVVQLLRQITDRDDYKIMKNRVKNIEKKWNEYTELTTFLMAEGKTLNDTQLERYLELIDQESVVLHVRGLIMLVGDKPSKILSSVARLDRLYPMKEEQYVQVLDIIDKAVNSLSGFGTEGVPSLTEYIIDRLGSMRLAEYPDHMMFNRILPDLNTLPSIMGAVKDGEEKCKIIESITRVVMSQDLVQVYGPLNFSPDLAFQCVNENNLYGGPRMFLDQSYVPDDHDNWFNSQCDYCRTTIGNYRFAVRRPVDGGGWKGSLCSWKCVRGANSLVDHETLEIAEKTYKVIDAMEAMCNQAGILAHIEDNDFEFTKDVMGRGEEESTDIVDIPTVSSMLANIVVDDIVSNEDESPPSSPM
jgi:hypothetical protein